MNKKICAIFALACACASLVLLTPVRAQSVYGSVFGTVSDSTGAAVPGATVTVTDETKGTVVTVTSNGSGDYSVPHLIPDVYDLKVEAKGFKAFETKGIQVEADTAPRIDPTMQVGGSTETVTVNADQEPELKTDKADVATVFDQQQMAVIAYQRSELYQHSIDASRRAEAGVVACGRRESASLAADPGGRAGIWRNGV